MYKLVMIDDEAYILKQLMSLLDWHELGFEIIASFEDSNDIFNYLRNNRVDVILSDINMPYPNGLDIAEYCSKHFPDIAVVLISGYRDFEYAHQAIKYNVFEYITKPISYEKFYHCMRSLAEKLTAQRHENPNYFMNLSVLASLQDVFFDLLYGHSTTMEKLCNTLTEFGLRENAIYMPCALLSIRIDNFEEFTSQNRKHDINNIYNAICNLIPRESDSSYNIPIRYIYSTLEILTIKKYNDSQNHFDNEIDVIRRNLEEILKLDTRIEIAKMYPSLSDLVAQKDSAIPPVATDGDLVSKVMEYIENNYKNPITLDDVSRYTAMSKGYFCSQYKLLTDESFITTLNKYRIERAKELLTNPNIKPSTVGQFVGYRNTQHFYRVFKSITGNTPNIYQTKVNANE